MISAPSSICIESVKWSGSWYYFYLFLFFTSCSSIISLVLILSITILSFLQLQIAELSKVLCILIKP